MNDNRDGRCEDCDGGGGDGYANPPVMCTSCNGTGVKPMSEKHSPGPWSLVEVGGKLARAYTIVDANCDGICMVTAKEDAALIASAPQLAADLDAANKRIGELEADNERLTRVGRVASEAGIFLGTKHNEQKDEIARLTDEHAEMVGLLREWDTESNGRDVGWADMIRRAAGLSIKHREDTAKLTAEHAEMVGLLRETTAASPDVEWWERRDALLARIDGAGGGTL